MCTRKKQLFVIIFLKLIHYLHCNHYGSEYKFFYPELWKSNLNGFTKLLLFCLLYKQLMINETNM